ncbi:hypothetical protein TM102_06960 [Bradyrhizobium sp. TM102]|nr:hypothetical protein TM102_06960 [Bradyrhizobium sp. TM102]
MIPTPAWLHDRPFRQSREGCMRPSSPTVVFNGRHHAGNQDLNERDVIGKLPGAITRTSHVTSEVAPTTEHSHHKDGSYETALRDGAMLVCSKMATCKAAATEYSHTR